MDSVQNKGDKASKEEAENLRNSQEVFSEELLISETKMNEDKCFGSPKVSGSSKTDAYNGSDSSKPDTYNRAGTSKTDFNIEASTNGGIGSPKIGATNVGSPKIDAYNGDGSSKTNSDNGVGSSQTRAYNKAGSSYTDANVEASGNKSIGSPKISDNKGIGSPKISANNVGSPKIKAHDGAGSSKTDAYNGDSSSKTDAYNTTASSKTDTAMETSNLETNTDKCFDSNTEYTELVALSEIETTIPDESSLAGTSFELAQLFELEELENATDLENLALTESSLDEAGTLPRNYYAYPSLHEGQNSSDQVSTLLPSTTPPPVDQNVDIPSVPEVPVSYDLNRQTENDASEPPSLGRTKTLRKYNRKQHSKVWNWLCSCPDQSNNYSVKRKNDCEDDNETNLKLKKYIPPVYLTNQDPSNRKLLVGGLNRTNVKKQSESAGKPKNEAQLDNLLLHSLIHGAAIKEEKEDHKNPSE